ncbi:hypothetical protein AVDCRST_MAG94-3362 [uncultured Leptolyngbya sp.]|uniref:Uncharacterized protein n=1 Tax=uncultured Leptolyngbya sp. TaxID=332963 RepID=A0A6J4MJ19_9CYAN|nr:hypothetical protein AVDCRST_MAG94-3362 [uncultured Leptolyngbya sp.]
MVPTESDQKNTVNLAQHPGCSHYARIIQLQEFHYWYLPGGHPQLPGK